MKKRHLRWNKLIKPRLQLRIVVAFAAISLISILMQLLLMQSRIAELAATLPSGGDYVVDALPGTMGGILISSTLLVLPLVTSVGILMTFRVAGPIYRFETYLKQVARGESVGPCRIRKDDDLQELCEAINAALEVASERPSQEDNGERVPAELRRSA